MSNGRTSRLERVLREGEVIGLYFTTAMLIVVEFCFVLWLNRIQLPHAPAAAGSGFIAMPPWYRKPRFEVTLLLTILAGLLFWLCWGLWDLRRKRSDPASRERAVHSIKERLEAAASVATLTGFEMALMTWLRT